MNPNLSRLFDEHAAASLDRQLALADAVGDQEWRFDLESGVLSFAPQRHWPVQILGTESQAGHTWLWSWANPSAGLPGRLLGAARLLRLLGEQREIPGLTEPELPLGDIDGHFLSLLARGVCRAVAYFRAPYEGGAAFLLLQKPPLPLLPGAPPARIASVFPRAVASLPLTNHKNAFLAYLHHYGLEANPEGDAQGVLRDGSPVLSASFDERGRLTRLEAILHP